MRKAIVSRTRCVPAVVLLVLGVLAASTSSAQTAKVGKDKSGKAQIQSPTPEDIQTLLDGVKNLVNQSDAGLTVYTLADGSRAVYLEDRFQNVALATVKEDGTVATGCVNNAEDARKFLKGDGDKRATKRDHAATAPALEVK